MRFSTSVAVTLLAVAQTAVALPRFDAELMARSSALDARHKCNDRMPDGSKQKSRLFVPPPVQTDFSAQPRPDAAHPHVPPGPGDQRGPCPLLNTLANHGYLPHSGIVKSEDIIETVTTVMNMELEFATFVVSYATMARGNPNIAMLSIGFNDTRIPPIPDCADGPVAGGLAMHGRFEGDISDSRFDSHVGDSVNFQLSLFETFYPFVEEFGEPSPDGPNPNNNLINIAAFGAAKYDTFNQFQKSDKLMSYHVDRQLTTYSEVGFVLELLAGENNNTHTLTIDRMTSWFQNQTIPPNFFRRDGPAGLAVLSATGGAVRAANPVPGGANDKNGNYIADVPAITNFLCDGYTALVEKNLWKGLNHQKGIFKQNIDTMLEAVYAPFRDVANCTTKAFPMAEPGAFSGDTPNKAPKSS